jgi:hypothetical protein
LRRAVSYVLKTRARVARNGQHSHS